MRIIPIGTSINNGSQTAVCLILMCRQSHQSRCRRRR